VIVRISGDDQYELGDEQHPALDELDNAVVASVEARDEAGFREGFDALLAFVREHGTPLPDDDLHPSDVIVPPADLTFEEAGQNFTGEGLVPDVEPAA
jgi:hypothetical protein